MTLDRSDCWHMFSQRFSRVSRRLWLNFTDLPGAFEDTSFASLAELVSESTLKGVKELGFEHMTEIQHKTIRPLLEGR